jgi:HlyD family secretion protein
LEAGTRAEEIAQAEAALRLAEADALRLKRNFSRQRDLFDRQVISPREIEADEAAQAMGDARVEASRAYLELLRAGPRAQTLAAARARLDQTRQAAALAATRRDYATLHAPFGGVVLSKGLEPGEYAMPGAAVVTIGDLDQVWLRAYLNETDLGRVSLGQSVAVFTDGDPRKPVEGRLAFIAAEAEFTPKSVQTAEERVKLVYRIKIIIPNPGHALKPGMPADAELTLANSSNRKR